MADPWIKMRCNLADDEAVIGIARAIKANADTVVGKLHRLWSWADRQSRNGHVRNVTAEWIDGHLDALGFADAMVTEGWLVLENGGVTFPKFDEHMSGLAKKRAFGAKRQSRFRHTKRVTRALPDRDRDRDSKKSTSYSQQVLDVYDAYPKHVGEGAALKAIEKALELVEFDLLRERTEEYGRSVEDKRNTDDWKYVPHPANWFNRDGWEDEFETVVKTIQPGGPTPKEQAEMDKQMERSRDAGFEWWRALPLGRQAELRRKYPPVQSEGEVALLEFDRAGRPGPESDDG